ncbi:hypothetical protein GBAR_LOCUS16236 [Geodia barretti]|uniref:Uncharacterized protein n=1 Tax=Geodia barretti TaxID=519541 RepID=A0AA35SH17_GEOBA|nr:hypothetical protein GBAR_LOCUS13243 [Geodia barretti]CAI8028476.1 hypothetical protein GBAR_LOCUS16236 [Geodia barretti]
MKRTRVVVAAVPLVVFAAVSFLAYGLSVSFRLPTPFNEILVEGELVLLIKNYRVSYNVTCVSSRAS